MGALDDMGPELAPDQLENYSPVMTGPGRWFVMVAGDGALFGVLWTDDRYALGLLGTEGSDPDHQRAGWDELRRAKAAGYTATETFDTLMAAYEPELYGEGELSQLMQL